MFLEVEMIFNMTVAFGEDAVVTVSTTHDIAEWVTFDCTVIPTPEDLNASLLKVYKFPNRATYYQYLVKAIDNGQKYLRSYIPFKMEMSPRQARLVLAQMNLLSSIEMVIEGLPEPQKTFIKIEWEYGTFIRYSESLVGLAAQMNLTETQLDQMFIAGQDI